MDNNKYRKEDVFPKFPSIIVGLIDLLSWWSWICPAGYKKQLRYGPACRVGAPYRMPCRLRKEVWLGPCRVRASCRILKKCPFPYFQTKNKKLGEEAGLFVLQEQNTGLHLNFLSYYVYNYIMLWFYFETFRALTIKLYIYFFN